MKILSTFKRIAVVFIALLALGLAGCRGGIEGSEGSGSREPERSGAGEGTGKPALTVCLDLDVGSTWQLSPLFTEFIKEYAPELKESYELEIEAIPGTGPGRESAMDNIRVEMMAGKGPDLFLCKSPSAYNLFPDREPDAGLFQYPKALMGRKMFLPLDDYIEDAKYMEWDKLYPQIMEAGRNGEGQQILPIGWGMSFIRLDAESYAPPEGLPMTFEEALKSDDPGVIESLGCFGVSGTLGDVADYEKDIPAFTEEELLAHLEGKRAKNEKRSREMIKIAHPVFFGRTNAPHFSQFDPESVLIPQYNRKGGATAHITMFGAVNINSKSPEGAFEILDLLLSKEAQRDSEFLNEADGGAPVHMELMKSKEKINCPLDRGDKSFKAWGLKDYNYDRLQELIGQINAVDFVTPVHQELEKLDDAYRQAETWEEREKLVHEAYTTMEMMLAES